MEPIEILKLAKLARECKCWAAHRHFMKLWREIPPSDQWWYLPDATREFGITTIQ